MVVIDGVVYLGSPYSHKDKKVRDKRARDISKVAARLMGMGYCIYCPIAETVMIAKYGQIKSTSWEFWKTQDLPKLAMCKELWVCTMPGWKKSKGVGGEMEFALMNYIPIYLLNPNTLKVTPYSDYIKSMNEVKE